MAQFVTQEEFQQFKTEANDRHEQMRKLITMQTISIDKKIKDLSNQLQIFVSKRPDPGMIRDFWIRQVPKIREELQELQIKLARMAAPKEKSHVG